MQMVQTPLAVLICPDPPPAVAPPVEASKYANVPSTANPRPGSRATTRPTAGRCTCMGQRAQLLGGRARGTPGSGTRHPSETCRRNGICTQRSQVKMGDITDGTRNTYLVGEKYLDPDYYFTGND